MVQVLGECLCQPVTQCLGHDSVVIVVGFLERLGEFLDSVTNRHRKRANIIRQAGLFWRNEISQASVHPIRFVALLPEKMKLGQALGPRVVREQFHIIPHTVGGEQTVHALGREQFFIDDPLE